jgi:hypothetical protein
MSGLTDDLRQAPVAAGCIRMYWLGQAGFAFRTAAGRQMLAICLLAVNVLAQTNNTTAVSKPGETSGGLNDHLVMQDGNPIGIRITVGLIPDYNKPEMKQPGAARIVTAESLELIAYALTEGENEGAVVGYLDDGVLMVREQNGKRLGKVFAPRHREKYRSVTEETSDGKTVTRQTYDKRPVTAVEAYLFDLLNWFPKE